MTKKQRATQVEDDGEDEGELDFDLGSDSQLSFSEKIFLAMFIYIQSKKLESSQQV
jgi:hypothetical protein